MKNEEILEKAIGKAIGACFKTINPKPKDCKWEYYSIIFNHDFAKAFWGEDDFDSINRKKDWKHHLQLMVLEEDPIKYLERFL